MELPLKIYQVRSVNPVKSGLLFTLDEEEYDSVMDETNTVRNIYYTSDGKTAKKISSHNEMNIGSNLSYNKPQSSNGFEYFCTIDGISQWNDSSKELTVVHPLDNEIMGCYGIQFGDDFFAIIRSETVPSQIMKVTHKDPTGVNITIIRDLAGIPDIMDGWFADIA
jgi:hypothetical protein